ncbi:MAG: helix-turn-helix transcriptional regulator [Streptosporangiaceae bacterium]|nr:helix-turn-helix transcriptional regulator [Streptosporangiaceae bacterium]
MPDRRPQQQLGGQRRPVRHDPAGQRRELDHDVAARLVIGEETVKSHRRSIYRKLEVGDRAGAVAVALREGIFH